MGTSEPNPANTVVVDTSRSPHARLRPVPIGAVRFEDAFWAPRLRRNREVTIPDQHRFCEETGRLDNFRRAAGRIDGPFQGVYFNDSDVYKWLEAASWALASDPDPSAALRRTVDEVVETVAAAQRPDGYINTYFARDRADERWTDHDLHEMYCAGHLFQAAVAHGRATGSPRLLGVARRFADHLCATFGPEEDGKRFGADGHEEVKLALVELARTTGERRYLDQARFFLDVRGYGRLGRPYGRFGPEYHQDHAPFRDLDALAGHAVRAVYHACGAADILAETGEPALRAALDRLWTDGTARKRYVTGGLGARWEGEAFGAAYELPNARAYAETCAAIGGVMWDWRLLALDGDARHADLLEHTLSNAVLPGLALDGRSYFYQNPLADEGGHRRQPWFGVACCPPNVARLLASLPGYAYSVSDDNAVWIHLYAAGTARPTLPDGRALALRQETGYPWDGDVTIEVETDGKFALRLRVPAWCERGAALAVNGRAADVPLEPGTYAEVRRAWRPGDTVRLSLPMPVRRLVSHPAVAENAGRVALQRGPILSCAEGVDTPGIHPDDLVLPPDAKIEATFRPDLLGGVVALTAPAHHAPPDPAWSGRLYRPAEAAPAAPDGAPTTLTAVPYHAWANRAPSPMRVWLRTER